MNENLLKEEILTGLGVEAAEIESAAKNLRDNGVSETPFRVTPARNMKFSIVKVETRVNVDADNKPVGKPYPMFVMNNGLALSPKHFQNVRGEVFPLLNSIDGMATYAVVHSKANTVYRIGGNMTEAEGEWGKPGYTPADYKISIVSSRLMKDEESGELMITEEQTED